MRLCLAVKVCDTSYTSSTSASNAPLRPVRVCAGDQQPSDEAPAGKGPAVHVGELTGEGVDAARLVGIEVDQHRGGRSGHGVVWSLPAVERREVHRSAHVGECPGSARRVGAMRGDRAQLELDPGATADCSAAPARAGMAAGATATVSERAAISQSRLNGLRVRSKARRTGTLAPLRHTFIADCETPVSAYLKLRGGGPSFLLESAEQGQRVGRWSFLGLRPRAVIRLGRGDHPDPYALVAEELERYRIAPLEGLPPFAGGAVGLFGYDLVRTAEPTVGPPNLDATGVPELALMVTDLLLAFDHLRHEVTVLANVLCDDDLVCSYEDAVAAIVD